MGLIGVIGQIDLTCRNDHLLKMYVGTFKLFQNARRKQGRGLSIEIILRVIINKILTLTFSRGAGNCEGSTGLGLTLG